MVANLGTAERAALFEALSQTKESDPVHVELRQLDQEGLHYDVNEGTTELNQGGADELGSHTQHELGYHEGYPSGDMYGIDEDF